MINKGTNTTIQKGLLHSYLPFNPFWVLVLASKIQCGIFGGFILVHEFFSFRFKPDGVFGIKLRPHPHLPVT